MSYLDRFIDFVMNELPKRVSSNDDPTAVPAGKIPVSTGAGLGVEFKDPIDAGPIGKSSYELAVQQGFGGTLEEYLVSLRGETGFINLRGVLNDPSELPTPPTGMDGYAYLIDKHLWVVVDEAWVDAGDISGPAGLVWHHLVTPPSNAFGEDGDFAILENTHILYVKKNGAWINLGSLSSIEEAPDDGGVYMRQMYQWKRLNRYDLKMGSTTAVLDVSDQQVFIVDGTVNHTLSFAGQTDLTRALVVVVRINGSGGVITWPANITWNKNTAPVLGLTLTVVTLFWSGGSWIGVVSATA